MKEKKFVAETFEEAVALVKREFGNNGVLISQRTINKGLLGFGMSGKTMVELTARPPDPIRAAPKASASYGALGAAEPPNTAREQEKTFTQDELAEILAEERYRVLNPIKQEMGAIRDILSEMGKDKNQRFNEQARLHSLPYEIRELKNMIGSINHNESLIEGVSPNLQSLYQTLVFNGVETKFARRLILETQKKIPAEKRDDFSYAQLAVAHFFMPAIKVTALPPAPYRLCLIGPTGVGKTTTIGKIASYIRQQNPEATILLISVDTFRLGATEQLHEYAKRIGVNFAESRDGAQLRRVMAKHDHLDYILIDTPGASQRDEVKMAYLKDMLLDQEHVRFSLVFSSTQKDEVIKEVTTRYGTFGLHSFIVTKADEATTFGGVFNLAIRFKKIPFLALTTGQKVPDDFEFASRERFIDLLMNISGASAEQECSAPEPNASGTSLS